ncbi:Glycosyl transferase, family 2 [hydrothermal vent metagenome]|uniref:Glycosyl transferase, family 2 n=1 Tax=hydrothermal vent metagenome TaxID=652676 RepID=A0A3B1DU65_9ZZZZ
MRLPWGCVLMKLSVLMPIYNEKEFLEDIVKKVLRQQVVGIDEIELIMVDDCSCDGTIEVVKDLAQKYPQQIQAFYHEHNKGKGAALKTAIGKMTGDICIVQDADLEYDPADYPLVLEPIIQGRADCVYGSRFLGGRSKRVLFFWHSLGNKFLTLLSNMFTNLNLTDMETCYKAFRCDILKSLPIESSRFGFEPEVTSKIAKKKCRIYEVGISYQGRTYEEGKKITWKDGVQAIWTILKYH